MELAPPTYEESTEKNVWKLVAKYVRPKDICSTVLVSKAWHRIFIDRLWGDPAAYFEHDNESVQDVLAHFLRSLSKTRRFIRNVTHVLHFPPDSGDVYDQPSKEWLADVIHRLPNLQGLFIPGTSFFNSICLGQLNFPKPAGTPDRVVGRSLRLLVATDCDNVTPNAMVEAFTSFPNVTYLDLSGTGAARDDLTIFSLRCLPSIKVLKLRRLRFDNSAPFRILCTTLGMRIQSLDLRDNSLDDDCVENLIKTCIVPQQPMEGSEEAFAMNSSLSPFVQYNAAGGFDEHMCQLLTKGPVRRLDIEDAADVGLLHLRISGNPLSTTAARRLLGCARFVSLDIGSIPLWNMNSSGWRLENLRGLKAHHSLISKDDPQKLTLPEGSLGHLQRGAEDDSLETILAERLGRLEQAKMHATEIMPMKFPILETLTLTNVPVVSPSDLIVGSLINFVKRCAEDSALARLYAKLDYTLPPGMSSKEHAASLFPLRSIVLQMSPTPVPDLHPALDVQGMLQRNTSITEDPDSSAFWDAGASDFSFFPGAGSNMRRESVWASDVGDAANASGQDSDTHNSRDNLAVETLSVLSQFRTAARGRFANYESLGNASPGSAGYWAGNIRVEWVG